MSTESQPLLSIVLPLFNEEETVPLLLECLGALGEHLKEVQWEVIFIDDHSTDETQSLLKEACADSSGMRYFRLAHNSGSHVAILAGLERARGACAVFLAADLQDPPELIPEMLRLWKDGHHVVWAVRESRKGVSFFERFSAGIFYWLINHFSNVTLPPTGSDFALLDRAVIDALLASITATPSLCGEIARLGFRQGQMPYIKDARQHGRSKWTLSMKFKLFIDSMVAFSYVPMRIMTCMGFGVSALAFFYAAVVVLLHLMVEQTVEGWATTMIVLLGLGGSQMIMMGVLGEYLWRSLEESRKRPNYFIEDEIQ